MDKLKRRLRFGDFDDIILLREVLALNPLQNPNEWVVIQEHVFLTTQKKFMIRTLKDHLERLVKLWLEKTKVLKGKSGIEEPQSEKDNLCQNIYDLMQTFKKEKRITKSSATTQSMTKKEGESARNMWASMSSNVEPVESTEIVVENIEVHENCFHDHSYVMDCEVINETNVEDYQEKHLDIDPETGNNKENDLLLPAKPNGNTAPSAKKMKLCTPSVLASTPTKTSKVLGPVRSRTRKVNAQKQGLAYLEKYDREQMEIKKKQMDLEFKKIALEEEKFALERMEKERNASLEERKMALQEFERKKQLQLEEQRLNMEEKKINLEIEDKKILKAIVERQENIINILINKTSNCK